MSKLKRKRNRDFWFSRFFVWVLGVLRERLVTLESSSDETGFARRWPGPFYQQKIGALCEFIHRAALENA